MLMIIIFASILSQQNMFRKLLITKMRNRKGKSVMTNEMLEKYIGKNCRISTGQFGVYVKGKIIDIKENWIELETKNGKAIEIINAEFVQSIKVV